MNRFPPFTRKRYEALRNVGKRIRTFGEDKRKEKSKCGNRTDGKEEDSENSNDMSGEFSAAAAAAADFSIFLRVTKVLWSAGY